MFTRAKYIWAFVEEIWVPLRKIRMPKLQSANCVMWHHIIILKFFIKRVSNLINLVDYICPKGHGSITSSKRKRSLGTVGKERPETAAIYVMRHFQQEFLIKFKGCRELSQQLVNTVQKLYKNRSTLTINFLAMSRSLGKLMTEANPILLNQTNKPFNRSISSINHHLRQGA